VQSFKYLPQTICALVWLDAGQSTQHFTRSVSDFRFSLSTAKFLASLKGLGKCVAELLLKDRILSCTKNVFWLPLATWHTGSFHLGFKTNIE
jgi:hypothetical protein